MSNAAYTNEPPNGEEDPWGAIAWILSSLLELDGDNIVERQKCVYLPRCVPNFKLNWDGRGACPETHPRFCGDDWSDAQESPCVVTKESARNQQFEDWNQIPNECYDSAQEWINEYNPGTSGSLDRRTHTACIAFNNDTDPRGENCYEESQIYNYKEGSACKKNWQNHECLGMRDFTFLTIKLIINLVKITQKQHYQTVEAWKSFLTGKSFRQFFGNNILGVLVPLTARRCFWLNTGAKRFWNPVVQFINTSFQLDKYVNVCCRDDVVHECGRWVATHIAWDNNNAITIMNNDHDGQPDAFWISNYLDNNNLNLNMYCKQRQAASRGSA